MRVLITGASSGLGAALESVFASRGHDVVGTSVDPESGFRGRHLYWDASLENSTDHLISHLPDLKFDIVINNAGVNAIRPFEQLTHAFVEAIMRVNFLAPVLLVQQLMARELLQRPAVICNITSDAAWRPMRHSLAYNCSKAAFDMATKQMARELTKPNDMTIFSVAPGKMTGTGMSQYIDAQVCKLRGWTPEEAAQYAANSTVTGKEFLPSSVAKVIYMLCTHGLPISGTRIDLAG